jgi:hypothetical protein
VNFPVPRNVGALDRAVRVAVGAAGVVAPVALGASWFVTVPVGLLAGSIAVSGVLGRCSIYHALGISSAASISPRPTQLETQTAERRPGIPER